MMGRVRSWKMMLCVIAFAMALPSWARAHGDHESPLEEDTIIKFTVDSSTEFNPAYDLLWEAMQPIYKGTIRDKMRKDVQNPIIGNAQIDLNSDGLPEFITYHVESEQERGKFCNKQGLCPYFIFDQSGKKMRQIGKVFAYTVDRGDSTKNGYWTLKVFTKYENLEYFEPYVYDPVKKQYAPEKKS